MSFATIANAKEYIETYAGKPLRIMEVCGTHTHQIFRLGLRNILPKTVTLVAGPGCPVCVTPVTYIDEALYLALTCKAIITTFGDLMRVPGSTESLAKARQKGADVRIVYSPLDALNIAKQEKNKEVVFLSVGFETTVPSACLAVTQAEEEGIENFSILCANKTMPMAYEALKGCADAFLYPGHVVAIAGTKTCRDLLKKGISGVVAGFTANELVTALATILAESKDGKPFFVNCYPRVVQDQGNLNAQKLIARCMRAVPSEWRGLGIIENSGLELLPTMSAFDARKRFSLPAMHGKAHPLCRCGDILRGAATPKECRVFGSACTPDHPIGACMVSSEGTCAAYYNYGEM